MIRYLTLIAVLLCAAVTTEAVPGQTEHTGQKEQAALDLHFPPGTSVVEVPFRDESGMIAIDVSVNGSRPLAFIIETGWSTTNLLMADDIGDIDFDFSGGKATKHQMGRPARGVRLDIGDLRIEGADMEVASKSDQELLGMLPEDGILGAQFLRSVVVEIDWERNRLRLHDPSSFEAPADMTALALETRVGLIFASGEITIDGKSKPIQFIVDTGSAGTLLLRADRVGVPERRISGVTLGQSLYGPVKGDIGRIEQLTLGGAKMENVVARFLDGSSNMVAVGADANLGTGVLSRFLVTFDYANKRMFLKPNATLADPFPFSTSGVAIDREIAEDGSVGIVMVFEGSPAARAGLTAGDRIISLDSTPVRDLGVKAIREQLRRAPGTKIILEVQEDGSAREVELELEALI